jgi:hypothetical protein
MLFSDNDVLNLDDLSGVDSEVSDVATAESVNIEGTMGILRLCWQETKNLLLQSQQQYSVGYYGPWSVLTTGSSMSNAARIKASQIVVSSQYSADTSWIKMFMVYRALALFFTDTSNRKVADRYQAKADRYTKAATKQWATLTSNGLPIVWSPLECPGALHGFASGIWSQSNVSSVPGGASLSTVVDVVITYVDQSRYVSQTQKNNAESGPSAVVETNIPAASLLTVSIAGLNPPNGQSDAVGIADGSVKPMNATGWNIYAAQIGGPLTLQNIAPIPISTPLYTFTGPIGNTGPVIGPGQYADRNIPLTKLFFRG